MSRYKLTIEEKTTRTHEVVIETDKSIDMICDYIERSDNAIIDPWDIRYIAGVNLVSVDEGEEDFPELEVLSVEKDGENHDD
jgi:hypothetical protein